MIFNLLTLVLATLTFFVSAEKTCFSKDKFTLSMFLLATNVNASLYAMDNGSSGSIILVADRLLQGVPGTTVYESGASPNVSLNVEVTDMSGAPLTAQTGIFHLSVADLGERYGASAPVIGSKGLPWPHWYTTEQDVYPSPTSAAQLFLACEVEVLYLKYMALSWGLANSDGSMPTGCYATRVTKKYDVQVPCRKGKGRGSKGE